MMEKSEPHSPNRYFQLILVIIAGGVIYPLLYLRQNFETSILRTYQLNLDQLGECYSILGIVFFLTYFPSGWLADKVKPRSLMVFSLLSTGALGAYFATIPPIVELYLIYLGWGISTGLTFWSAMIKATAALAHESERGLFFGLLEGGRGVMEAMIATVALYLFSVLMGTYSFSEKLSLQVVVALYSALCFAAGGFLMIVRWDVKPLKQTSLPSEELQYSLKDSLPQIIGNHRVWCMTGVIMSTYMLFWSTYSFSAFLQVDQRFSVVSAGGVTVAKLWMRPIGSVLAGFLGDRYQNSRVCFVSMLISTLGLALLSVGIKWLSDGVVIATVMLIGFCTYAARGVFWALLNDCRLNEKYMGLAIGFISLIGYAPDIFLPQYQGWLSGFSSGYSLYKIYFLTICCFAVLGMFLLLALKRPDKNAVAQIDKNFKVKA